MVSQFYRCEIVKNHMVTTINLALYLEKDVKLACGAGARTPTTAPPAPNSPPCVQLTKERQERERTDKERKRTENGEEKYKTGWGGRRKMKDGGRVSGWTRVAACVAA